MTDAGGRHPDTLLSFYDAVLYHSDLELLAPRGWLNDHCIVFQCEYLTFVTHGGNDRLLFVHPGTSHFVTFAGEHQPSSWHWPLALGHLTLVGGLGLVTGHGCPPCRLLSHATAR